ncbi:MAG: peptide deformylase [Candidatus Cloacimonetes bacterium]|nr:peptide deformylase [Candidatus Cloacimonadota bacterium]
MRKKQPEALPIRVVGDKVLRSRAEVVDEITDGVRDFIDDLVHTMYLRDGAGLAAPQVGRSLRIFAIDPYYYETKEKQPQIFINPRIVESGGSFTYEEGCLSLPGIFEKVKRPGRVIVEAMSPEGELFRVEAEDYGATVLQHEYDHLDGVLFIDRVAKLRLLPWKRRIRELEGETDDNGVNILADSVD